MFIHNIITGTTDKSRLSELNDMRVLERDTLLSPPQLEKRFSTCLHQTKETRNQESHK